MSDKATEVRITHLEQQLRDVQGDVQRLQDIGHADREDVHEIRVLCAELSRDVAACQVSVEQLRESIGDERRDRISKEQMREIIEAQRKSTQAETRAMYAGSKYGAWVNIVAAFISAISAIAATLMAR